MEDNEGISLQEAVDIASWTYNTNIMVSGFTPLQLIKGKSLIFPGLSLGNEVTESMFEDEGVRTIIERQREVGKKFREYEFGRKLETATSARAKGYENIVIESGDEVYYQTQNEKTWLGTSKVKKVEKNWVWIVANGDLKKVPKCNVRLYRKRKIEKNTENKLEKQKEIDDIIDDIIKRE